MEDRERNELINKITDEVLAELETNVTEENFQTGLSNEEVLILIPEFHGGLGKHIEHIKQKNKTCNFTVGKINIKSETEIIPALPGDVIDISQPEGQQQLANNLKQFEQIYLLSPPIKSLKQIIELDDENILEWIIIQALLKNIQVSLLHDFDLESNLSAGRQNSRFKSKIKNYLRQLTEIGIDVVGMIERSAQNESEQENIKQTSSSRENNLINSQDIEDIWQQGKRELEVQNAVITPLALDKARELGLKVNY